MAVLGPRVAGGGVSKVPDAPGANDGRGPDHVLLSSLPTGPRRPYDGAMTGTAKLALTAALFALTLAILGLAAATHSAVPLFFMWVPLLVVPWVLTRPEPGQVAASGKPPPDVREPEAEQAG